MASDQQVGAQMVLRALMDLQRQGPTKALVHLEQTEPDLAEFLIEGLTRLHHAVLDTGASSKQARRIHGQARTLVLVSIAALKTSQYELWRDAAAGTRLAQLDPGLGSGQAPPDPPTPPDTPPNDPPTGGPPA